MKPDHVRAKTDAAGRAEKVQKRRACVVCDEVKARHTSHWDLDVMSHAELHEALGDSRNPPPMPSWKAWMRSFAFTFLVFAALALGNAFFAQLATS